MKRLTWFLAKKSQPLIIGEELEGENILDRMHWNCARLAHSDGQNLDAWR
jgi:hypothetical protein